MSEMSSILTLEVAWEHKSLWPSRWDESYTSWNQNQNSAERVAETNNHSELLKSEKRERHVLDL